MSSSIDANRAALIRTVPFEPDSKQMPTVKLEILLLRAARFGPEEKRKVQHQLDRAIDRIERRFGDVVAMSVMDPQED